MERRPMSLVCACSTHPFSDLIVRGEASGYRHPGAIGPGVGLVSCGAPGNGAEENRLIRRPSVSSQTKRPQLGGNCWSRGRKVRLLLESAVVESRPSWRLRSCTHSRQLQSFRQSAVLLIAFLEQFSLSWNDVPFTRGAFSPSNGSHANCCCLSLSIRPLLVHDLDVVLGRDRRVHAPPSLDREVE